MEVKTLATDKWKHFVKGHKVSPTNSKAESLIWTPVICSDLWITAQLCKFVPVFSSFHSCSVPAMSNDVFPVCLVLRGLLYHTQEFYLQEKNVNSKTCPRYSSLSFLRQRWGDIMTLPKDNVLSNLHSSLHKGIIIELLFRRFEKEPRNKYSEKLQSKCSNHKETKWIYSFLKFNLIFLFISLE